MDKSASHPASQGLMMVTLGLLMTRLPRGPQQRSISPLQIQMKAEGTLFASMHQKVLFRMISQRKCLRLSSSEATQIALSTGHWTAPCL